MDFLAKDVIMLREAEPFQTDGGGGGGARVSPFGKRERTDSEPAVEAKKVAQFKLAF